MRGRILFLLGVELSLLLGPAAPELAAQTPDTQCSFRNYNNMVVRVPPESSDRGPLRVMTAVDPPGGGSEVEVECGFASNVDTRSLFRVPQGKYPNIVMRGVERGRPVSEPGRSQAHWFLPVEDGDNRVTVRYGTHPPVPGTAEIVRETTLKVWRSRAERWGQLELPTPAGAKDARLEVTAGDAAGNFYGRYVYRRDGGFGAGLVRFAPGGRIAVRYQVSAEGTEKDDTTVRQALAADDKGNLLAVVNFNLVLFDPQGKFVRSLGAFDRRRAAASLAELGKWLSDDKAPWAEYQAPRDDLAWPSGKGGVFVILFSQAQKKHFLVRLSFEGRLDRLAAVAGDGTPYASVDNILLGPDGNLYVLCRTAGAAAVQVFTQEGKPVRTLSAAEAGAGQWNSGYVSLSAILGDGTVVDRDGYRRTWDAGHMAQSALHWRVWQRMGPDGKYRKFDLLTGQPIAQKPHPTYAGVMIDVEPKLTAAWVHGGQFYYLYDDGQVSRVSPAGGGKGGEIRAAAAQRPDARFVIARVGGDFAQGVALDGATPVNWTATFLDAAGNPLAGVPVRLSVADGDLPARGRLTVAAQATDAEGRVAAAYVPPRVTVQQAGQKILVLGFQARAQAASGSVFDGNENARGIAVRAYGLRLSHPGFAPSDPIPVTIAPNQAQALLGTAVYRPPAGRFDSRFAAAVKKEYPLTAAKIELLGEDGATLGTAEADAQGAFRLDYQPPSAKGSLAETPLAETPLAEPLALTAYAPGIAELAERARDAFARLEGRERGFDTARLLGTLAAALPERLAAATGEEEAKRQADILERMGLLAASVMVTQDLATHAVGQFADSLSSVFGGLLKFYKVEPIDFLKSRSGASDAVEALATKAAAREQAWLANLSADQAGAVSLMRKMQSYVLHRLLEVLAKGEKDSAVGKEAIQTLYEATLWSVVKDTLGEMLSDWIDQNADWKGKLGAPLNGAFRKRAQGHLDAAAAAWAEDKVAYAGAIGPAVRNRYAELAERKAKVAAAQYSLDLYKADVDLAFNVGGNAVKIFAGLAASPAAAKATTEGVEALEKFSTLVNTGLDAYQGTNWLADAQAGMDSLDQIARLCIRMNSYCFGDGC